MQNDFEGLPSIILAKSKCTTFGSAFQFVRSRYFSENAHTSRTDVYFNQVFHTYIYKHYRDTGMQNIDKALPRKCFVAKPSHRFCIPVSR